MAEYTSKLNLYKPNRADADVTVDVSLSENFRKIDDGHREVSEQVVGITNSVAGLVNARKFGVQPSNTVGNSASLQALIDSIRQGFISSNMTTQPVVFLESGVYILDAEVKMSPYLKFKTLGTVIFKITHNGTGIHITPNANDPAYSHASTTTPYLKKNFWNRGKYFDGNFVFISDLDYESISVDTVALEIGARDNALGEYRPISRYTVGQINVFGVSTAIKLNTYHNYIGTFENCHIEHVKHAFVWGNELISPMNSGEKFSVRNSIIAGCAGTAIKFNASGVDFNFTNTSFDFNSSPLFTIKESGVGLRMTDCYIEEIDGEQLMLSCKPNSTGSTYGRNTVVINGLQVLLKNRGKFVENLMHATENRRMNLTISVSGLEVRHIDNTSLSTISKTFLVDTSESITLTNKDMIINPDSQCAMLTSSTDIAGNGDFSKSTVGIALNDSNDVYWKVSASSGVSNIVGNNGIDESKSIDVTLTNTTTARYIKITGNHKIPALAGQSLVVMPSIKGANIDSGFSAECSAYCYDVAGNEIDKVTFYAYFTASSVTLTEYSYPRYIPKVDLPKGTVSVIPEVALANLVGSTALSYSVNNILVAVVGD